MNSTDLLTIVQRSKLALERLAALDISGTSIPTDLIAKLRELAVYIDTTAAKNHGTVMFTDPLRFPSFQYVEEAKTVAAAIPHDQRTDEPFAVQAARVNPQRCSNCGAPAADHPNTGYVANKDGGLSCHRFVYIPALSSSQPMTAVNCGCDLGHTPPHICAEHLEDLRRATAVLPNLPTCPACGSTLTSIGDPEQLTYCDTCDREVVDPT